MLALPTHVAGELDLHRHAQEGCGNGCEVLVRTLVVGVEQQIQLLLQLIGSTVLFSRLERIHGWPVVFSEGLNERVGCAGKGKSKCVSGE